MTWIRNRPLGLVYRDPAQSLEGHTLFCSVRGHHATLLDHEGRIVHQWHHPEGIQHLELLANGNLLIQTLPPEDAGGAEQIGGSTGVLAELDWESRVVWEYRDPLMHHDYVRLENGHHLVMAWDKLPAELNDRVQGGHLFEDDPKPMWADVVKEITPGGEVAREWRSWEHLSFEEDVICPLESHKEWTHANSIALTPEGDWLISFRLTSTLAIIDGNSGAVKWRWGPGHLSHQHCASWLDNGHILVFDNGCHRPRSPSFSRVVELDPEKKEVVWSYFHPTVLAFYSFMVSGCERLANGNTFITEGATGRLFEVTSEGETVWEYVSPWILPSNFGPTPAVFRAFRIPAGDPRLAGRELSVEPYEALTRRIEANEVLGEHDQGLDESAV
jgi:hypothetical protein